MESVLPKNIEEKEIVFDSNENIIYTPMTEYLKETDTLYFVSKPPYPDNKPVIKFNGKIFMNFDEGQFIV